MDSQEAFNRCAEHLLNQGVKALDTNADCVYRSPDGLKCAVGAIIPDDKYHPDMENVGVPFINQRFDLGWSDKLCDLLDSLQSVHDDSPPERWVEGLVEVATIYNLDASVVN